MLARDHDGTYVADLIDRSDRALLTLVCLVVDIRPYSFGECLSSVFLYSLTDWGYAERKKGTNAEGD